MYRKFELWDSKNKEVIPVEAKQVGKEYMALCPKHDDHNPSLSINPKKGCAYCHSCGWSPVIYNPNLKDTFNKTIISTYDYKIPIDEKEKLLYQIVKYEGKDFIARRPDGKGGWIYNLDRIETIPYNLPKLIKYKNDTVFIVEGEKDADNLLNIKVLATTNPFGAGSGKWKEEYNKYFTDRDVVLIPDNDDKGKNYMLEVGRSLLKVTDKIKWIELPGLQEKEDVSDWIAKGGNKEKLKELLENAPLFKDIYNEPRIYFDDKFEVRPYAEYIIKNYNIKYFKKFGLWKYNDKTGLWVSDAEKEIDSILRKKILNPKHIKKNCVDEIIKDIQGLCFTDEDLKESSPHLIPFKNKIYDLNNDCTIEYSPEYFFISKLPVNYNPENKECPTIDKIFKEIAGESNKDILYEFAAYCMYRSYPFQKFFIPWGVGQNGKTVFTNILISLLGENNVSTANLKDLQDNRFITSELQGKLLNISEELDPGIIKKTSKIKQATGGSLLTTEKKFKDFFKFRNYAKILIVTNDVPKTIDKTTAFIRRVYLIPFPNEFIESENAIPEIEKTIPIKEYESLAFKCIEKLKELKKRNFIFSKTTKIEEAREQYEKLSNPLYKFLRNNTVKVTDSFIKNSELKERFTNYLNDNNIRTWSDKEIGQEMKRFGYEQKPISRKTSFNNYTTVRVWFGISWK